MSLNEYLYNQRVEIDTALDHLLPVPPNCPPLIDEIIRYSVFAGGKRLRPILTLATASSVSKSLKPDPRIMVTACAIEMIHTYSLIHDDLPAMDNDELRRGRPTTHIVYGEGMAILAGDALLTEAFGILSQVPNTANAGDRARTLRTIKRVATAAGVVGLVGGQAIDLKATGDCQDELGQEMLRTMHSKKTGALIRAAAVSGAIMAGASDTVIQVVDDYASNLGLAFQIVDDILDVEGATDTLGKTAGKDAAAGKPTYPALYGLEKSRQLAATSIAAANDTLKAMSLQGRLSEIADWVLQRTS